MPSITHPVTCSIPTDEADAIAREHATWAANAGLSPRDVLLAVGCAVDVGSRSTWTEA